MSKSLGNSPEPLDLIAKFGADGVRVGMLLCSPAGNDLLYEDSLPEQGRNFANKIWNDFRLVRGWNVDEKTDQPESSEVAVKWMNEAIKKSTAEIDSNFRKFRISEALMNVYKLIWDEFSGWYLESIKPDYGMPIDKVTYEATSAIFDNLLRLLHPFMPFISEEIWQMLEERKDGESLMVSAMPASRKFNKEMIMRFDIVKETISAVRTVRKEKNIPNKESLILCINSVEDKYDREFLPLIARLCNLSDVRFIDKKVQGAASFMVQTTEFFIPLGDKLDVEGELARIGEELEYNRGFLASVMKKLDNERFVKNAPASVIDLERKKKSDTESKIKSLQKRVKELKKK
jgi:valyl-tRNA synthetase